MAINSGILLAQENQHLHTTVEDLQQKKKQSNQQIGYTDGLSIQEDQDLIQRRKNQDKGAPRAPTTTSTELAFATEPHSVRAPPRCSNCHILGHTRRQCPSRFNN